VAVLDIQMPQRSGIDVARTIRAERLPVGILVLTAFDDEPYVRAVLQAGANGYVLKTADAEDIVDAVRAVQEGKSVLDPAIARQVMRRLSGEGPLAVEALTGAAGVLGWQRTATPTRRSVCAVDQRSDRCKDIWRRSSESSTPPAGRRR
jgi:DNA-binding NarL/FixJ family response regulator